MAASCPVQMTTASPERSLDSSRRHVSPLFPTERTKALFVAPDDFTTTPVGENHDNSHDSSFHLCRTRSVDNFVEQAGSFEPGNVLHIALRSYFENQGPECCIVPGNELRSALDALPEIDLVVAAGQDISAQVLGLAQLHEDVSRRPAGNTANAGTSGGSAQDRERCLLLPLARFRVGSSAHPSQRRGSGPHDRDRRSNRAVGGFLRHPNRGLAAVSGSLEQRRSALPTAQRHRRTAAQRHAEPGSAHSRHHHHRRQQVHARDPLSPTREEGSPGDGE